jgi:transcriptional regulator with XRE-family HTH domain
MQMTPIQSRMARAALGWSIAELAEAAKVRAMTVSNFERGGGCYASTVQKLQGAMERAGIVFVSAGEASIAGGVGIRLRGDA